MPNTPAPPDLDLMLHVAQIVPCTEAEGPGRRFALWFQGCPLRCPGCCNPEMLPFEGGEALPLAEVVRRLREAAAAHGLEGITLLGGEPLAHGRLGHSEAAREWFDRGERWLRALADGPRTEPVREQTRRARAEAAPLVGGTP